MRGRLTGAAVEIRAAEDGRHLHGVLIQEGRAASGGRAEVFAPGAVEWPAEGVGILTAHRQAPEVRAMPSREPDGRITVKAPATVAIREAVEGGRRFMSVEFHSLEERTTRGGVREILRAFVPDAALVADPEFDVTSAEVRRRLGGGGFKLSGKVRKNRKMDCRCAGTAGPGGKGVRSVRFTEDAFDDIEDADVVAVTRGADSVVSSTRTGTLRLASDDGLRIEAELLDTAAARDLRSLVESGEKVVARPLWDGKRSTWHREGDTAVVTEARFNTVLIRAVPGHDRGLEAVVLATAASETPEQRRRLWL
ncbi:MAG: HK97 family phage prohead protease [Gemmatimonadetes bacterium]|nr:HK97 family phage prohead protease [Gemmatimonadota bacterium]